MMEATVTLRDVQNQKSTLELAQEIMLRQLRERRDTQLTEAEELARTGLMNSFGAGPRDYDRRDTALREQAALLEQRKALEQHGKALGYGLALECLEANPPLPAEPFSAYERRVDKEIRKAHIVHCKKAGELALQALSYSASHPEYGPARAAAVRAEGAGNGLREALCVALELLQGILKRDEEAQAAKNGQ